MKEDVVRRSRRSLRLAVVLGLYAWSACSDPLAVPGDPDAAVQTDRLSYRLVQRGLFLETRIGYTYRNSGTTPIYIQNCGGAYEIVLEQLQEATWKVVWGNATPDCISPAIVVAPGGEIPGELAVSAGTRACGCGGFETSEVDGVYRLVFTTALDDLDPNGFATGSLVAADRRTSNPFSMTR